MAAPKRDRNPAPNSKMWEVLRDGEAREDLGFFTHDAALEAASAAAIEDPEGDYMIRNVNGETEGISDGEDFDIDPSFISVPDGFTDEPDDTGNMPVEVPVEATESNEDATETVDVPVTSEAVEVGEVDIPNPPAAKTKAKKPAAVAAIEAAPKERPVKPAPKPGAKTPKEKAPAPAKGKTPKAPKEDLPAEEQFHVLIAGEDAGGPFPNRVHAMSAVQQVQDVYPDLPVSIASAVTGEQYVITLGKDRFNKGQIEKAKAIAVPFSNQRARKAAEEKKASEDAAMALMAPIQATGDVRDIAVADIVSDPRTQPRITLDTGLIDDYANTMMADGYDPFPPVVIFFDGKNNWLADGFHRVAAARNIGLEEVKADVREGGVREAILFSVQANESHGLRRSRGDKRRAVLALLQDKKWRALSNITIAKVAKVSDMFVGNVRKELEKAGAIEQRTSIQGADGKTYEAPTNKAAEARDAKQQAELSAERDAYDPTQLPQIPDAPMRTPEGRAFEQITAAATLSTFDPEAVADAAVQFHADTARILASRAPELGDWITRFMEALSARLAQPLKAVS